MDPRVIRRLLLSVAALVLVAVLIPHGADAGYPVPQGPAGGGLTGNYPNPSLNLAGSTSGTLPASAVTPGSNGQVLTTTGGVSVWGAASGGITALTQDVTASGTGSVAATVTQLQAGEVTVGATTGALTCAATATACGETQASTSNVTPSTLLHTPQASTATNGNGGAYEVNLPNPLGTGSYGQSSVAQGGTALFAVGHPAPASFSGHSDLWLGANAGTPSTPNTAVLDVTSAFTQVQAPNGTLYLDVGGGNNGLAITTSQVSTSGNANLSVGGSSIYGAETGVLSFQSAGTAPTTSLAYPELYASGSTLYAYPGGVTAPQFSVATASVATAGNFGVGGLSQTFSGTGEILVTTTGTVLAPTSGTEAIYSTAGASGLNVMGHDGNIMTLDGGATCGSNATGCAFTQASISSNGGTVYFQGQNSSSATGGPAYVSGGSGTTAYGPVQFGSTLVTDGYNTLSIPCNGTLYTMTEAQSRSSMLFITCSSGATATTVKSAYAPVSGRLQFVRATCPAGAISFEWSSGTAVAFTTNSTTSQLITSDGTNAITMLQGT